MREPNAVRIVEFTYTGKTQCWYTGARKIRDVFETSYYFATEQYVGEVFESRGDAIVAAAKHVAGKIAGWQEIAARIQAIFEGKG